MALTILIGKHFESFGLNKKTIFEPRASFYSKLAKMPFSDLKKIVDTLLEPFDGRDISGQNYNENNLSLEGFLKNKLSQQTDGPLLWAKDNSEALLEEHNQWLENAFSILKAEATRINPSSEKFYQKKENLELLLIRNKDMLYKYSSLDLISKSYDLSDIIV